MMNVKRIIHGDIKAANILLNEDFKPVIANFGLAIIMDRGSTDVFRDAVNGTIGHIPPELFIAYVRKKTDVFGYGAFLLELITGQRVYELARLAHDEGMRLLDWVKRNCEEKQWKRMADPDCGGVDMEEMVKQLSVIALLCSHDSPEERPKMSEIRRMLEVVHDDAEWWDWDEAEKQCNLLEMNIRG